MTKVVGFTFNKAIGAGVGGLFAGLFIPALLGVLHWVAPVAGAVNPVLGLFVGGIAATVTYLFPKNAPKRGASEVTKNEPVKPDPRGPNKSEPTTKAKPAPTEQPGRKPGKSR